MKDSPICDASDSGTQIMKQKLEDKSHSRHCACIEM